MELAGIYGRKSIRLRRPDAISHYQDLLTDEIHFYQFLQYEFYKQWNMLKEYANQKGIQIIGDIPIYVAYDSADVWAHPELFQLDESGQPTAVAGCPPDGFFCYRTALGESFISVGLSQRNRIFLVGKPDPRLF